MKSIESRLSRIEQAMQRGVYGVYGFVIRKPMSAAQVREFREELAAINDRDPEAIVYIANMARVPGL